jgi:hypothetical protein
MEYFLPSIAALLIAALIVFLILPRLGASALVGLSVVLLIFCLYNHYKLFGSEYRYSTWQEQLKFYAPFLMYGSLTVVILLYLGYLFNKEGPSMIPASNISDQPKNIVESVNNTANTILTNVANGVGIKTNQINANAPILTNLGNILSSPNKRNNRIM